MILGVALTPCIRKMTNGIGNRPAFRNCIRPFPVYANITSESDNENPFSILRNAIINRIDKLVLYLVFQPTIFLEIKLFKECQMLSPCLSLRNGAVRVCKAQDYVRKVISKAFS